MLVRTPLGYNVVMHTRLGAVVGFCLVLVACSEDPVRTDGGRTPRDGSLADGTVVDGAPHESSVTDAAGTVCGEAGVCLPPNVCFDGRCIPEGAACTDDSVCVGDDHCVSGRCRPYIEGENDMECIRDVRPGVFAPSIQCRFDTAPADDAFPNHTHVFAAVVVGDLAIEGRSPDREAHPSIVATFDTTAASSTPATAIIRVLDGQTCELQATLSTDLVMGSSSPAIADLDNDGVGEIVALKAGGGLIAYRHEAAGWTVYWRSTNMGAAYDPAGAWWTAPTIVDLDDDGFPEVVRAGHVFDGRTGAFLGGNTAYAGLANYDTRGALGAHSIILDVDEDGLAELIDGNEVYRWDINTRDWVAEDWSGSGTVGHVAVADLGPYTSAMFGDPALPEIVVVSNGAIRAQTLEGTVVFGPLALPGGGLGGPPTIADFDGDGLAEMASAGAARYAVFDPDCTSTPRTGGQCASGTTDGILWNRPSQDASSAVTGSTSFDFEGDGRVEAVYADECFLRVYDGQTGEVLYSTAHSSCTWYEFPIVADVDGDSRAEIVMGSNHLCGTPGLGRACPGLDTRNTDLIFAGLHCQSEADCRSGSCVEGLCRCTDDAECCGEGDASCGFVCTMPPSGTPGAGNTCRAARDVGPHGVRVFRDVEDRWVGSRTVWNQHAYHVTNIGPDLRVPRTSMVTRNWRTPGLNHFRTNVQGEAATVGAPDATIRSGTFDCTAENVAIPTAEVCNRGTAPVSNDVVVAFYEVGSEAGTTPACSVAVGTTLQPGRCTTVSCQWPTVGMRPVALEARIDDTATVRECREDNNIAAIPGVACPRVE